MAAVIRTILAIAGLAALAGCGQKGPLVLPPAPAAQSLPPVERPAEGAYPDVPATTEKK